MNPSTLHTILNSAPLVLQGANRLIDLIRERNHRATTQEDGIHLTLEGLKQQVDQVESRLRANDEADLEQIQLIQQLARQNDAVAESLQRLNRQVNLLTAISITAVLGSALSLALLVLV